MAITFQIAAAPTTKCKYNTINAIHERICESVQSLESVTGTTSVRKCAMI
jgi:hypothetical protein